MAFFNWIQGCSGNRQYQKQFTYSLESFVVKCKNSSGAEGSVVSFLLSFKGVMKKDFRKFELGGFLYCNEKVHKN